MLADDVRLELVNRLSAGGERVREYYGRYAGTRWQARLGWVDGMPAALVFDADDTEGRPVYFVLLEWSDGRIAKIRDFLFARYVMEDAEISVA